MTPQSVIRCRNASNLSDVENDQNTSLIDSKQVAEKDLLKLSRFISKYDDKSSIFDRYSIICVTGIITEM